MRCGTCKGRKTLHAGDGVCVPCPGCKGQGTVTMTLAERVAAKVTAKAADAASEDRAALAPKVLRFVVPGDPIGKERPRVFSKANAGGTVVTRAITPEKTRTYEAQIRTLAQIAVNHAQWAWSKDDMFTLFLRIYTTHRHRHPDATNVIKCVEDACNLVTWHDDIDVLEGAWTMRQDRSRPRVEVEIRRARRAA